MKLNSFSLAAAIFVLLFGGISVTSAMNWWQTESTKVPARYTAGEASGEYNPADIRGSYSFGDISELFDVPLSDLQAAFRLPAGVDPAGYQVKSLEEQFAGLPVEMGTSAVRMFVAFYQGLPFALDGEESYLFPEAAAILKAHNKMLPEQSSYLEAHILEETLPPAVVEEAAPEAAPETVQVEEPAAEPAPTEAAPAEHVEPEGKVTGKTTFQDLLDWGLTPETIEAVLGEPMPAPQTVVKDFVSLKGLEFSTVKNGLQAEVDKAK